MLGEADSRDTRMYGQVERLVKHWRGRGCGKERTIIGIDANTAILPDCRRVSGKVVRKPIQSHSSQPRNYFTEWASRNRLMVPQTKGTQMIKNAWTRKQLWNKSQIDDLVIAEDTTEKEAKVTSIHDRECSRSDHYPVVCKWERKKRITECRKREQSLKGWCPSTEKQGEKHAEAVEI